MRGCKRVEVDWGDILEELALVEDADQVSADESTKTVSSNREFRHDKSTLLEFLYFLQDLRVKDGIEQPSRARRSQRDWGWKTDLFSNSFPSVVNAVIRVIVHIRVCDEKVEFSREVILRVRPLPSYLPGHLGEMSGVSPHPMNKYLHQP